MKKISYLFILTLLSVVPVDGATTIVGGIAGNLTIKNSIIHNDTTYLQVSSGATVTYCAVRKTIPTGTGNVLFSNSGYKDALVSPQQSSYSYYLSPTSSLRNAGIYSSTLPSKDINGNDRIFDTTTDIGAVEYSLIYQNGTNNWSTPAHWNIGRIPTTSDVVALRTACVDTSSAAVCKKLIIESTGSLTINPGKLLTVSDSIRNKVASRLVIKADASGATPNGSLIFNNTTANPVYATVEMYSKSSYDTSKPAGRKYNWQFFGVPVSSVQASPTFDGAYVRKLLENGTDTLTHWQSLTNSDYLVAFRGYELCYKTAGTVSSIAGALINGDYNSGTLAKSVGSNILYSGQNLLANSYTAAMPISQLQFGSAMQQTVYLYNTGTYGNWKDQSGNTSNALNSAIPGQYTAVPIAQAGGTGIPSTIPSMSSILVTYLSGQSQSANGYVAFSYSALTKNKEMQRVKSTASKKYLTLIDVVGEYSVDRMWLFADDGCTRAFDNGYDGPKVLGSVYNTQLYATEADGDYQINTVDDINNTDLMFWAGADTSFTLNFSHENMSDKYEKIYLYDMVANKQVDVTENGSTYSFNAVAGTEPEKRFRILTQTKAVDDVGKVTDNSLTVYSKQACVYVHNYSEQTGTVQLFDITGRVLRSQNLSAMGVTIFSGLHTGDALLLKTVRNGSATQHKVVVCP